MAVTLQECIKRPPDYRRLLPADSEALAAVLIAPWRPAAPMQAQGERCSDASVPASVLPALPSKLVPGPTSSCSTPAAEGSGKVVTARVRRAVGAVLTPAAPAAVAQMRSASSGVTWRSTGLRHSAGESAYLHMQIRSPRSRGGLPQCSLASLEGEGPTPAPCRGSLAGAALVGVATMRARGHE